MTQRHKVREVVRGDVISVKQTVRLDVVNISTRLMAMLAGVLVASSSFALLSLPVRPSVATIAVDVLRVTWSDAMFVSTGSSAVPPSAWFRQLATQAFEGTATTDAQELDAFSTLSSCGDVLTTFGTRSPASVRQPGAMDFERFIARLTNNRNHQALPWHVGIIRGVA